MKKTHSHLSTIEWHCLDIRGRGLQKAFLKGPPSSGGPSGAPPFDLVFDKGFLDAYISIDHEDDHVEQGGPLGAPNKGTGAPTGAPNKGTGAPTEGPQESSYDYRKAAEEYFEAVFDVLKEGGSFVLISLAQDYILKEFVRIRV